MAGYKGIKNVGQTPYKSRTLTLPVGYFAIIDASEAQEALDAHTNAGITGLSLYPKLTAMASYASATIAGWSNFAAYSPFKTDPAWPTMVF